MLGADTHALIALSERMRSRSAEVRELGDRLSRSAETVTWVGPDRTAFDDRLHAVRAITRTVGARLEEESSSLAEHAEEQDEASSPDAMSRPTSIGSWREALSAAQSEGSLDDLLRELFGASGDATPGSLGGFEDPEDVPSRRIDIDLESLEEFDPRTVVQGDSFGNCWFLAALASVAQQNPELIAENIRLVEGETPDDDYWIVTLYENGDPVEYTVTQDELVRDGVRERVDHSGSDGYHERISWMSIYERAAVEHVGGDYGDLEANFAGRGFDMITGDDGRIHFTGSFDDIRDTLDGGGSVVSSTPPGWMLGGSPSDEVVDGHVYVVEGFDTNEDGDEVIVLVNPWGKPDHETKPDVLELTQEEYLANFVSRNSLEHD